MSLFRTRGRTRLVRAQFLLYLAAAALPTASLPAQSRTGSAPAPARLWAAQISPRELTLVWDSVPGAASFRLYRGSGESAQVLARPGARVLRWVVPVKPEMVGAPQQFAIEALDAAGLPSARAAFNAVTPIAATPGGPPEAGPATVTASEGGGGVTLTWDAVPGATAYAIGRSVRPGGLRPLCALCSTETTYVDRSPTAGAVHAYSVTALTPRGSSRMTRSNEVTPSGGGGILVAGGGGAAGGTGGSTSGGTGTGGTSGGTGTGGTGTTGGTSGGTGGTGTGGTGTGGATTTATAPPPPPASLVARKVDRPVTGVEVSWQGGSGTESFRVSRVLCNKPAEEVASVKPGGAGSAYPWLDTIPAAKIRSMCTADFFGTYSVYASYSIVAVNAAGSSPPAATSLPVPFKITGATLDAMSATPVAAGAVAVPTPLSAQVIGKSAVSLNWQSSAGATMYLLSYSVCGKPAAITRSVLVVAGAPNVSETAFVDWTSINTLCPLGTKAVGVVYSVAAKSGDAVSAPAQFPLVALQLDTAVYGTKAPPAPSSVWAGYMTSGGATISWGRQYPPAAIEYRIERALGAKATFQPLATVPGDATSYTDSTANLKSLVVSYRITAVNPIGSSPSVQVTPR